MVVRLKSVQTNTKLRLSKMAEFIKVKLELANDSVLVPVCCISCWSGPWLMFWAALQSSDWPLCLADDACYIVTKLWGSSGKPQLNVKPGRSVQLNPGWHFCFQCVTEMSYYSPWMHRTMMQCKSLSFTVYPLLHRGGRGECFGSKGDEQRT